jgi:hypothetical protein
LIIKSFTKRRYSLLWSNSPQAPFYFSVLYVYLPYLLTLKLCFRNTFLSFSYSNCQDNIFSLPRQGDLHPFSRMLSNSSQTT